MLHVFAKFELNGERSAFLCVTQHPRKDLIPLFWDMLPNVLWL